MTRTILEAYAEYLKDKEPDFLTYEEDKFIWAQFLKERYGIPYTEDKEDGKGQEKELRQGGEVAGYPRASSATSRT